MTQMTTTPPVPMAPTIRASQVHETLRRHLLVDGYSLVVDLERSQGSWLADATTGKRYLDLFMFFASAPVGHNHPRLRTDAMLRKLGHVAVNNVSNSDFYTIEMAEFVDTFSRLAMPAELPHLFLIAGGGPAVDNALKVAFDWKAQKNFERGYRRPHGQRVIHFEEAFHGRTGYALSITATPDQRKTRYFPGFDWPRIINPKQTFPLTSASRRQVAALEQQAVAQIERACAQHPDDIAAIIIEPIQGEGGDNHFRPEFVAALRRLADAHEALLIFDEVQTGIGMTGAMWAHEHFAVRPDIMVFGKKVQVCGLCASARVDEVERNVFVEPSRINSTWGGNLVDMVRATEFLRIIDEEKLIANAASQGQRLLAGIESLVDESDGELCNPRGRGLMCAFDLRPGYARQRLLAACLERELIIAPTGTHGIRFRPALNVTAVEIDAGLDRLRDALRALRR